MQEPRLRTIMWLLVRPTITLPRQWTLAERKADFRMRFLRRFPLRSNPNKLSTRAPRNAGLSVCAGTAEKAKDFERLTLLAINAFLPARRARRSARSRTLFQVRGVLLPAERDIERSV